MGGDPPDTDEPAREILAYYNDNDSEQIVSALLGGYAMVFFLFFNGRLRRVLRAGEGAGPGGLSATSFAGGILVAVGGAIFSAITFTLGDLADDMGPETAQTLHLMNESFFFPLAIGVATFLIAAGGSAIRTGALPRWLGWGGLVIGVLAVTPVGFFAFLASFLWVIVTSVLLTLRAPAAEAPPASTP